MPESWKILRLPLAILVLEAKVFDGSPRSFAFTFNLPLRNEKMGLGIGFINDEIGVTSATQIFGAYSYKIILNDNAYPYWKVFDRSFISFGLNAGALLYNQGPFEPRVTR